MRHHRFVVINKRPFLGRPSLGESSFLSKGNIPLCKCNNTKSSTKSLLLSQSYFPLPYRHLSFFILLPPPHTLSLMPLYLCVSHPYFRETERGEEGEGERTWTNTREYVSVKGVWFLNKRKRRKTVLCNLSLSLPFQLYIWWNMGLNTFISSIPCPTSFQLEL